MSSRTVFGIKLKFNVYEKNLVNTIGLKKHMASTVYNITF